MAEELFTDSMLPVEDRPYLAVMILPRVGRHPAARILVPLEARTAFSAEREAKDYASRNPGWEVDSIGPSDDMNSAYAASMCKDNR
jgi:hypothetical protein